MQKLSILNIVIYYDNEDEVIDYATELSKQNRVELITLIIVVNKYSVSSFTGFRLKLEKLSISFRIYFPDENLGYLNGAVYGYQSYIEESNKKPDWVLISNTDISFTGEDFFANFLDTEYEKNISVVGPSVYSPITKSYSNPQYVEKNSRQIIDRNIFIFSHPFLAYFFMKASIIKSRLCRRNKLASCYTFTVHGCFFFVKPHVSDYLANNPFGVHLYSEEGYVANIVHKFGKKIFYDSTIEVIHSENATTKFLNFSQKSKYIGESLKVIRNEFY